MIDIYGQKERTTTHPGGSQGGFTSGMARPHDDDIIIAIQFALHIYQLYQ
jgi:hypothetical protein